MLSGDYNHLELRGYQVMIADPAAGTYTSLMPTRPDDNPNTDFTSPVAMNYRGSGFFPQRPLDVAVSEQGWIYVSVERRSNSRFASLRSLMPYWITR